MATLSINLTLTGETAASVSLLTLTDSSGVDVSAAAGLTLPTTFDGTAGNGQWTISFTDTGATSYLYTYRIAWSDGSHDDQSGTKNNGSVPTGYPTTTASALFLAQKTLLALYTAASTNPGGVVRVNVDGQEVQYANATDLQAAILFWQRQVAILSGTRRRTFGVRLDGF